MATGFKILDGTRVVDMEDMLVKRDEFSEGNLFTWGWNHVGQLGDNTSGSPLQDKYSPVQTIAGGANWKYVSCGVNHTAGIKTDGTLWTWGENVYGQLGNNTLDSKSSPIQTSLGGTDWKYVSCNNIFSGAIKTDGTLWMWGANTSGKLGDGSQTQSNIPIKITTDSNWVEVSLGTMHTTAIKIDGTLWCWGQNASGQLGNNSTASVSTPVQTSAGGTNWKTVASGDYHTIAIKTDGTLWGWGQNNQGQLGIGNTTYYSTPIQIMVGTNTWKQASCGNNFSAVIKTDGTLWTFGWNNGGELGDGTQVQKSTPIQVGTATTWKQVSCAAHVLATKIDGTLWAWGIGQYGGLGDGTNISKSTPVQIGSNTYWKIVSSGVHSGAVMDMY